MVKVSGLANYRSRRHEPRDFDAEVSRVEAEAEGHSRPDWVLLLCGRGLSHGRTVAIRIELRQADPPSGHISVHTVGEINFDRDDPLPVERGEGGHCHGLRWLSVPAGCRAAASRARRSGAAATSRASQRRMWVTPRP